MKAGGRYRGLDRLDRFLDWLLGGRCERCLERVFPGDRALHDLTCS